MEDGLVNDIIQDHKGLLWFATWNGLYRFDGYNFKNYKSNMEDLGGLTNDRLLDIVEDKFGAQITVIDSTVNTVLQGLYVLEACRLRDMGLEYQQIVDALLPIRETGRIFFTIGSIDYLKHGGRIGKLAGIAASALKIKPLITLKEGEIFNSGITRNRLKSMKKVVDMTREYLDEVNAKPGEYSFCIGYGYDYNEALEFREMLKDLVKERLGIDEIGIYQIGATIGVHTGPYPIGIGIIKHALTE